MQFQTHEDRRLAVKQASAEVGSAYGELKYKEFMLREMMQSFVPGETEKSGAPVVVKAEPEVIPVKTKATAKKATSAPKKADVQTEIDTAPETVTESTAEVVEAEVEGPEVASDTVVASDCPISTATELRQVMLEQFNKSGRSAEAQAALKAALTEATGCDKVMDVTPEQVADGYAAIMAVEV